MAITHKGYSKEIKRATLTENVNFPLIAFNIFGKNIFFVTTWAWGFTCKTETLVCADKV